MSKYVGGRLYVGSSLSPCCVVWCRHMSACGGYEKHRKLVCNNGFTIKTQTTVNDSQETAHFEITGELWPRSRSSSRRSVRG
ncbi:Hypothetical protein SMAX5B_001019 [Scophthalmus maximus]|uniref:Uncharacterized protein n=1 Tax=Scophthalmus maximus TaxID=52904 RepID=A0A2U9C1B5_SCOMX|nr:Hypothetical protein SMAX5B_001019 [Scophthalmus maximus]